MKTALIIGSIIVVVLIVSPLVFGLIWGGQYGSSGMMGPGGMMQQLGVVTPPGQSGT